VPARLDSVRRCPARPEYIELCFTTPEGTWRWCFLEPARRLASAVPVSTVGAVGAANAALAAIALTVGPHGVLARRMPDGGFGPVVDGPVVDASVALSMILAGAEVVVARRLVIAGR
jgi:hypothetical protein